MLLLPARTGLSGQALPPCTCRRAFSLSSRSLVAPYLITTLPSRALLSVQGPDSTKFLQGLVSNDVRRLAQRGEEDAPDKHRVVYANILKADGRYMQDIMLYPPRTAPPDGAPGYLVEHDSAFSADLRKYFKRHLLRSKAKLGKGPEEELVVTAAWRNPADVGERKSSLEEVQQAERWLEERKIGWDPRVNGMGYRWVAEKGAEKPPRELFFPSTPDQYHLHRLIHAVPEGPADFPALPLEANFDFMNGVDYRKGCYVGQELTARTHHKGVVRKRGVVFRLFREGEDVPDSPIPSPALVPYPSLFPLPPPGSTLTLLNTTSSRPRASGKLGTSLCAVSSLTGQTLALAYGSVRLDHLDDGEGSSADGVFVVKAPVSEDAAVESREEGKRPRAGRAKDEVVERGDGAGESDEEGGRWLAKGFKTEWLEFKLEEEAIAKGL
ncbi:Iba57p [Rhodotorula paludigena]|uniref:Iba57p n=1 Tax=Rhodotorula paludigena TaxID=86838 RepID=UPI003172C2D3